MDDKRLQARLRVRWRVALRNTQHPLVYGETLDVSLGGAGILSETSLAGGSEIDLFFQIPPKQAGKPQSVVETRARVQYGAFSPKHNLWRLGIQFLQFKGKGKEILERAIRQAGG